MFVDIYICVRSIVKLVAWIPFLVQCLVFNSWVVNRIFSERMFQSDLSLTGEELRIVYIFIRMNMSTGLIRVYKMNI